MKAPRPAFVQALLFAILLVVVEFVLPWLNLPFYILWVFVAVYAVYVLMVIVFGRHSSDVKS